MRDKNRPVEKMARARKASVSKSTKYLSTVQHTSKGFRATYAGGLRSTSLDAAQFFMAYSDAGKRTEELMDAIALGRVIDPVHDWDEITRIAQSLCGEKVRDERGTSVGAVKGMSGVGRIAEERRRQIEMEGWTPTHDDEHDGQEMAMAAVCYAACAAGEQIYTKRSDEYRNHSQFVFMDPWPWDREWDKRSAGTPSPAERIRMLEKAGALIAAEIDRQLRRIKPTPLPSPPSP